MKLDFPKNVFVIGLTGSIGSGKSTVAQMLLAQAFPVIDLDRIAKDLSRPGSSAWTKIVAYFGKNILTAYDEIDRSALAKIIFQDAKAKKTLEHILHPAIMEKTQWLVGEELARGHRIIIVEVPLLFETGLKDSFSEVWVVASDPKLALKRLLAQGKWSEADIKARQKAQIPIAEKIKLADQVIDNGGDREALEKQVRTCAERLQRKIYQTPYRD